MAKRPSASLVIVSEWGMVLSSPVRKKRVVATSEEDAPLSVTLSLSSCTEKFPEDTSRKPKTVTAEPSDKGREGAVRGTEGCNVAEEVNAPEKLKLTKSPAWFET